MTRVQELRRNIRRGDKPSAREQRIIHEALQGAERELDPNMFRDSAGIRVTKDGSIVLSRPAVLRVLNDTETDIDPHGVIGLDDALADPSSDEKAFKVQPAMTGSVPSSTDHANKFGITLQDIRGGRSGDVVVTGAAVCQVDVSTEGHEFATVKNGEHAHLESSADEGARILWKESGTGVVWAIILLGSAPKPVGSSTFPALITGHASVGDNRWEYDFEEAEYQSDGTLATKLGGTTGKAYNRVESNHTASLAWGIDTSLADYPSGHAPRPVGAAGDSNTHDYDVGVLMEQAKDNNDDTIYFFQLQWDHDGDCEASS